MTNNEIKELIDRSLFASLGYTDEGGRQNIRRVFCVWHKGIGMHLISTNTSSSHVRSLLKNGSACLYFSDDNSFEAVCLYGKAEISSDKRYRELLWNEGDEKYYPKGIDDEDYCIIVFTAESGRYYRYDGKADLSATDMAEYDSSCELINGYSETHR
ncbi:MAG: pyridoxamine 5'-phosphate oxidase family protein [Ruminococcus sp.]|nr:pyridoxamine 5'-phosphate oxidase family protein [Ruminococcus sp.]